MNDNRDTDVFYRFCSLWIPVLFFCNFAVAASPCAEVFSQSTWLSEPDISQPVQAYLIPNGNSVTLYKSNKLSKNPQAELPENSLVLTKQFVDQTHYKLPEGSIEIEMRIYKYGKDGKYALRGSGRELVFEATIGGKKVVLGIKGAGTNEIYSQSNGGFDIANFRTNGLQTPTEVISELIFMLMAEKRGIPATPVHAIRLARIPTAGGGSIQMAQTIREHETYREAWNPTEVTDQERQRLTAALYLSNFNYGAINPENLSAKGKVVDPGHFGPTYPTLSGIYRCTMCASALGSRWDGTHQGPLDHALGPHRDHENLNYVLTKPYAKDVLDNVADIIQKGAKFPNMTGAEFDAVDALMRQKIGLSVAAATKLSQSFNPNYTFDFDRLIGARYLPTRAIDFTLSFRFLLQVAGLKKILIPEKYSAVRENFLKYIIESQKSNYGIQYDTLKPKLTRDQAVAATEKALNLFERFFDSPVVSKARYVRSLYSEFLPSYAIVHDVQNFVDNSIASDWDLAAFQKLLKRLLTPTPIDPKVLAENIITNAPT